MRQSEWKKNFYDLPVSVQAIDTGWKKSSITKVMIQSLLTYGSASQLDEHSENYIFLKESIFVPKTMLCLILAIAIIGIQIFWKN